ncbi:DUF72 domain-containing protein [Candidatus Bathyarchaeota archaeon]|nr:DUF72 domain-containing protein [Candidatus Bathyarchaeota archaeon]
MSTILLGTSGWSYKEWIGPFYDDEKRMFSYYAKFFNTVEINSTFYRYPSRSTIYGLNRAAPPNFIFSAKLPRLITHKKKLDLTEDIRSDLMRFLELLEPLYVSGRLGCILIQLPPSFKYESDYERLEGFLDIIPDGYEFSVEFRDSSWMREDTWRMLRKYGVAYCVVDEPSFPSEVHVTADFAYFRWHGRNSRLWYNYRYSERELSEWVPKLEETGKKVKKIYGYFNNHFHGYAIENCIELMQMLKIAEPKHEKVKRKIIEYNLYGGSLSAGLSRTEREVWQLLLKLTDLNRIKRGRSIGDEELIIEESSEDRVRMRVKEYTVEFLLGKRILRHDCDDWRRGLEEKRLCKHVVKALLSMKPERARDILEDIIKNKRFWRFQQF